MPLTLLVLSECSFMYISMENSSVFVGHAILITYHMYNYKHRVKHVPGGKVVTILWFLMLLRPSCMCWFIQSLREYSHREKRTAEYIVLR